MQINQQHKAHYFGRGSPWRNLLVCWREIQPLIRQGYLILNKKVTLGMPGPCMPALDKNYDIGIGSPYSLGAESVWRFWDKAIDNILLGPEGKTFASHQYSPYVSDTEQANPFLIPPEKLLAKDLISPEDMDRVCGPLADDTDIDFEKVTQNYNYLLTKLSPIPSDIPAITKKLLGQITEENKFPYIADLQIQISRSIYQKNKALFLPDFTLGTPADTISDQGRDWKFPVLDPEQLWDGENLGPAGKLWQHIIDSALHKSSCGLRIDHFIGYVNPYVMSHNPDIPNGRLYSSPDHPILKKYAYTEPEQFYQIYERIVLPVLKKYHISNMDLYPEDIGARPPQLDDVLQHFNLGRLIVAQFKEPQNPTHMYQLMTTKPYDVATIDTHDTPSVQMFFDKMDDKDRALHAQSLVRSLRLEYDDSFKSTEQLTRMQWAELLACPAERVQAFFTSWTGQVGYYSHPDNIHSWHLRCTSDFKKLYFSNLLKGLAYNPLDAIALAIYARGDSFYKHHAAFIEKLHAAEDTLKKLIQLWQN
ncbi:MAG: 4-alpha-glucanotransferase [Alphaproteobacteria bacterium]|nr:4-alpha-glucanotransferase [Alphaproteobacteria bacterium]